MSRRARRAPVSALDTSNRSRQARADSVSPPLTFSRFALSAPTRGCFPPFDSVARSPPRRLTPARRGEDTSIAKPRPAVQRPAIQRCEDRRVRTGQCPALLCKRRPAASGPTRRHSSFPPCAPPAESKSRTRNLGTREREFRPRWPLGKCTDRRRWRRWPACR